MLYFVPEILFSLYFIIYTFFDKINFEDNKYWFVFLFCVYFSLSSLWFFFKADTEPISLFYRVSYDALFIKSIVIFIATIGSFFVLDYKDLLKIVIFMIFAFLIILFNSRIFVLSLFFLFDNWLNYIRSDKQNYVNLISACLYFLYFISFLYSDISLISSIFLLFVLYSNITFSFLNLLINDYGHKIDNVFFTQIIIKNIVVIFYVFEIFKSVDLYNLIILMGTLDTLFGCSMLFLQNNLFRIIVSTCMIFSGLSFFLVSNSSYIFPVIIYYLLFFISLFPLILVINYLLQRKTVVSIYDISGIAYKDYLFGFSIIISSLSLIGFPFTAGFLGKVIFVNFAIYFSNYFSLVVFVLGQLVLTITYFRLIKETLFDEYFINHDRMKVNSYYIGIIIIGFLNMAISYLPWFTYNVMFIT